MADKKIKMEEVVEMYYKCMYHYSLYNPDCDEPSDEDDRIKLQIFKEDEELSSTESKIYYEFLINMASDLGQDGMLLRIMPPRSMRHFSRLSDCIQLQASRKEKLISDESYVDNFLPWNETWFGFKREDIFEAYCKASDIENSYHNFIKFIIEPALRFVRYYDLNY